jgi:hypothetical protein
MAIIAKVKPSKEFEPLEPGPYLARCGAVISVGWQKTDFGIKDTLFLRFEVPAERIQYIRDGEEVDEPKTIYCQYNNNLHEKAKLRKHLDNWLGTSFMATQLEDGFYLDKLLGKPCQITVIHKKSGDKTFANVDSVTKVMKGQEVPPQELDSIFFGPDDTEDWEKLPEFLQKKFDAQVESPEPIESKQADMKVEPEVSGPKPVQEIMKEAVATIGSHPEVLEADFHEDDIPF